MNNAISNKNLFSRAVPEKFSFSDSLFGEEGLGREQTGRRGDRGGGRVCPSIRAIGCCKVAWGLVSVGQGSRNSEVSAVPAVKVGKLLRFRPVVVRAFIRDCWSAGSFRVQFIYAILERRQRSKKEWTLDFCPEFSQTSRGTQIVVTAK